MTRRNVTSGESPARYKQGPYEECWTVGGPEQFETPITTIPDLPGDPDWHDAHRELGDLHVEKSSTYGNGADPLANFTTLAAVAEQAPERYVLERIVEKCVRALNMIDAGDAVVVQEYPDIASLGLCAEALRRRRA